MRGTEGEREVAPGLDGDRWTSCGCWLGDACFLSSSPTCLPTFLPTVSLAAMKRMDIGSDMKRYILKDALDQSPILDGWMNG